MGTTTTSIAAKQLFKESRFGYYILSPQHGDKAQQLISRSFLTEPATELRGNQKPEANLEEDLMEFTAPWMQHCSTNNLSVIAVDETNNRVAAAFLVKDFHFDVPSFNEIYENTDKTISPLVDLLEHVADEALKVRPELNCKETKIADFFMLGVHPDYRGNKIANYLMQGALMLSKEANYQYAVIEATNTFTSKAAKWNNFINVYDQNVTDWMWNGKKVFANIKPPHGVWTFWMKNLSA